MPYSEASMPDSTLALNTVMGMSASILGSMIIIVVVFCGLVYISNKFGGKSGKGQYTR
jgi:hypothetical protein